MNLTSKGEGTNVHSELIDLETDPWTSMHSTCNKTTTRILNGCGPTYKKLRGKGKVQVRLERFLLGVQSKFFFVFKEICHTHT